MATTYSTGTINQPDAGSVGLSMIEKIRDEVVAHPAWDLVEEYTAASGLIRWYVLRCLAAQSGLPSDFYIVMGRTLATGVLHFSICESYNPAAHTMTHFGHSASGSTLTYDSEGRTPNSYVLGSAVNTGASPNPYVTTWTPGGTSTKWWIIVTEDNFTVAFNGASNSFVHCGVYVPLSSLPILMPIQVMGYQQTTGAITRNPAAAGQTTAFHALAFEGGGGSNAGSYGPVLGFQGEFRYNDKLQGNQRPVAEQGMAMTAWAGNNDYPQSYGWALGKQKRMRVSNKTMPVGFAFGDAFAMQDRLWVPWKPDDGRIWDTGVAAS